MPGTELYTTTSNKDNEYHLLFMKKKYRQYLLAKEFLNGSNIITEHSLSQGFVKVLDI